MKDKGTQEKEREVTTLKNKIFRYETRDFKLINKGLKESGITLIALVVTIIILIILLGISLKYTLTTEGITSKSETAIKIHKKQQVIEKMYVTLTETALNVNLDSNINEKLEIIKQKEPEIKDSAIYKGEMFLLYEGFIFTVTENLEIINVVEKEEVNVELEIEKTYYNAKIKAKIVGLNVDNVSVTSIQKEGDKEIQGAEGTYEFDQAKEYKIIVKLSNGRKVEKIINMDKITEFDVFDYCSKTKKSLESFGMTKWWNNSNHEITKFVVGFLAAGHGAGEGYFSANFSIPATCLKEIISYNNVFVRFNFETDGKATIQGKVIINYTDGTNNSSNTKTMTGHCLGHNTPYDIEVNVDKKKIVKSIDFYMDGNDYNNAGCNGYIEKILLRDKV